MQPTSTNAPVRTTPQATTTESRFVGLDILADYACTQRQLEVEQQHVKPVQKLQKATKAASRKKQQDAAAATTPKSPRVSIPQSQQPPPSMEEEEEKTSTPFKQSLCDLIPPYSLSTAMEEAVATLRTDILYRPLTIRDFQDPEVVVVTSNEEPIGTPVELPPPPPPAKQQQPQEPISSPHSNITPPPPPPQCDISNWAKRVVAMALAQIETIAPTDLADMDALAQVAIHSLEFVFSKRLSNAMLENLLVLTRSNMKHMYDNSGDAEFIWCDRKKRGELRDERMHWLLLHGGESSIVGFAAFKFCTEKGIPHAYLHELQIVPERKGQGLGTILINALIRLCVQLRIPLILLTVFSSNLAAIDFYLKRGFEVDECSPSMCFNLDKDNPAPYEIMSMTLDYTMICPYKCTIQDCDFVFRFEDSLEHHHCEVHGAAWPVPCPHCPRGVLTKDQLHRHCELMQTHPNPPRAIVRESTAAVDARRVVHPKAAEMLYTRVRVLPRRTWGLVVRITDKNIWHVRMDGEAYQVRGLRTWQIEGLSNRPSLLKQVDNDGGHVSEEEEDDAAGAQREQHCSPKRKAAAAVVLQSISSSSSDDEESESRSSNDDDDDGGREFRRSKRLVDNRLARGKRRSSRCKKQICYREPQGDTFENE